MTGLSTAAASAFNTLPKGFLPLWALLVVIWCAANMSLQLAPLITGALISMVLAFIFAKKTSVWQNLSVSPTRIYYFLRYTGVFFAELVRANINMMRYVYAPRITIRPAVVRIRTQLQSPIGRLALANSIALTPGSLVLEIEGDSLFIHWLDMSTADPDEARRIIAGPFEQHLEKAFG
jgi:multicomponent Na+:H+ antiporter subunit E